jgi:hypothetical protein
LHLLAHRYYSWNLENIGSWQSLAFSKVLARPQCGLLALL